ncbi:putative nitrilase [Eremomyces bilateralis CBS 781.70]|uniref:Nitrilase n=1 Tax=Eremomyces bilateralis CBS 781.70 TaxID=1392243 RepID=A0A6G1G8R4_9PEZI|nr:putative nitrilase [Eremomyces bilateralis CBS 781.70]KAF1814372.1 putative nitrilase [Eremomyces bilateralis CBS 781.70]
MAIAAVGQICSTSSMMDNLLQCQNLVQKAASAGAKAIFFPEASDYIASSAAESVSLARSLEESDFVQGLQRSASENKIHINVGVHAPAEGGIRVKNLLLWIDDNGKITEQYQKLHLFDVEIKDGPVLRESHSVEKGDSILPPFDTVLGRVGLAICFDLRFPEISVALRRRNADIITFPSAFTIPTGKAHWEVLLRARAIETQSYVVAAAQVGQHNEKRVSYGHSMIISPWGSVLAELGGDWNGGPELATAEIDLSSIEKIRKEMPLLRRTDVYPEI